MRVLTGLMSLLMVGGSVVIVSAADGPWKLSGMLGATYNSTSVTENWQGPEKNTQSWSANLNASAEQDTVMTNWLSTLTEQYGTTQTAGTNALTNADLIDLDSVYTFKLGHFLNPYLGFIATTQNWKFLNPVTYTESIGDGFWLIKKPEQELRTRFGLAFRQVYQDNPEIPIVGAVSHQTGAEWNTNYMVALNPNTKLESEARLFSAFDGGDDMWWNNSLYFKLSSLITMQLNYLWIYNYNMIPHPVWPQDSERRFSVIFGFAYNLF
ncbi:MAG: DUF481 domain-containing protein [Endomicrobiales bacterium]|jgi:hypothetical protein